MKVEWGLMSIENDIVKMEVVRKIFFCKFNFLKMKENYLINLDYLVPSLAIFIFNHLFPFATYAWYISGRVTHST